MRRCCLNWSRLRARPTRRKTGLTIVPTAQLTRSQTVTPPTAYQTIVEGDPSRSATPVRPSGATLADRPATHDMYRLSACNFSSVAVGSSGPKLSVRAADQSPGSAITVPSTKTTTPIDQDVTGRIRQVTKSMPANSFQRRLTVSSARTLAMVLHGISRVRQPPRTASPPTSARTPTSNDRTSSHDAYAITTTPMTTSAVGCLTARPLTAVPVPAPNARSAPTPAVAALTRTAAPTSLPDGPNDNADPRIFTPKTKSSCGDKRNSDRATDTTA